MSHNTILEIFVSISVTSGVGFDFHNVGDLQKHFNLIHILLQISCNGLDGARNRVCEKICSNEYHQLVKRNPFSG